MTKLRRRYNDDLVHLAGHARVFAFDGDAWHQRGDAMVGEAWGNYAGYSVSLSADGASVAVGAYGNDAGNMEDHTENKGHCRVYDWAGGSWAQRGLDIDGEARIDQSGRAVALSGDGAAVVVGAYANDGRAVDEGGGLNAGHARVWRWVAA